MEGQEEFNFVVQDVEVVDESTGDFILSLIINGELSLYEYCVHREESTYLYNEIKKRIALGEIPIPYLH